MKLKTNESKQEKELREVKTAVKELVKEYNQRGKELQVASEDWEKTVLTRSAEELVRFGQALDFTINRIDDATCDMEKFVKRPSRGLRTE